MLEEAATQRRCHSKQCVVWMTSMSQRWWRHTRQRWSHSSDGVSVLAGRYQSYTANCITDKNVIKYTSKPLQCNLSPQSTETTDKTDLIYFFWVVAHREYLLLQKLDYILQHEEREQQPPRDTA